MQKELFNLALAKLKEALKVSIMKKSILKDPDTGEKEIVTEVNVPLLKEIHAIFKTLQERIEGAPIQRHRHEIRSQNLNVHVGNNSAAGNDASFSPVSGGMVLNVGAGGKSLNLDDPGITMEDLNAFGEKLDTLVNKLDKAEKVTSKVAKTTR